MEMFATRRLRKQLHQDIMDFRVAKNIGTNCDETLIKEVLVIKSNEIDNMENSPEYLYHFGAIYNARLDDEGPKTELREEDRKVEDNPRQEQPLTLAVKQLFESSVMQSALLQPLEELIAHSVYGVSDIISRAASPDSIGDPRAVKLNGEMDDRTPHSQSPEAGEIT